MNFNKHSKLEGQHAFLGASKYHWINYDEEKIAESYLRLSCICSTMYIAWTKASKICKNIKHVCE